MVRLGSLALAGLCAAVPAGAGAGAGTLALPAEVVVVQAANHPAPMLGATERGLTYTVTVTGVYTYDGAFGLSDCGHQDPASDVGWQNRPNVTVDGHVAGCFAQPFSPAHTYRWTEPGTGAPFVFEIHARSGDTDDTGVLVVTVTRD